MLLNKKYCIFEGKDNIVEETDLSEADVASSKANAAKKMLLNRWMYTSGTLATDTSESGESRPQSAEISGFKNQVLLSETPREQNQQQSFSEISKPKEAESSEVNRQMSLTNVTFADIELMDFELSHAVSETSTSKLYRESIRDIAPNDEHQQKSLQVLSREVNDLSQNNKTGDMRYDELEEYFGHDFPMLSSRDVEIALSDVAYSSSTSVQQEDFPTEIIVIESSDEDLAITISSEDENCSEDFPVITRQSLPMPYGKARFILTRTREFSPQTCIRKGIECALKNENDKWTIRVHGNQEAVIFACADIKKLSASLFEIKHAVKDSAIGKYYESCEGKDFLETTARRNNCIIMMPSQVLEKTAHEEDASLTHTFPHIAGDAATKSTNAMAQSVLNNEPQPSLPVATTTPLSVHLVQGDIAMQQADAIVNPLQPSQLSNMACGSAVSKALASRAGPMLTTRCAMLPPPFLLGNVLDMDVQGLLPCSRLYHAFISPFNPNDSKSLVQTLVWKSLFMADSAGFSSIAFPAMATGGLQYPAALVAQWMKEIITNCAGNTLRTIIIVLHPSNPDVTAVFQNEFSSVALQHFSGLSPTNLAPSSFSQQPQLTSLQSLNFDSNNHSVAASSCIRTKELEDCFPASQNDMDDSIEFYIYSNRRENIEKTIKSIADETDKTVLTQVLLDDALEQVTDWEIGDIKGTAKRNKIRIAYDKNTKEFELRGLIKDVMKANEEVKKILRELTTGEAFRSYVSWEKKTNVDFWEEFPVRTVYALEKAFKAREKNSLDSKLISINVTDFENGTPVEKTIDISALETDPDGIYPPHIRRKIKGRRESDVPENWTPVHRNELFKKEELQNGSVEFAEVQFKFDQSKPRYDRIIKIERIQNPFLYRQYKARKEAVQANFYGHCLVRELFHGTLATKVDKICASGFDRNFAGENGTAFGKGMYFAVNSAYSVGYSGNGIKSIFLAEVITGEYAQGRSDYKVPPEKNHNKMLYDSVVDNVQNPKIFVVFRDSSAYPLYLVTFC